MLNVRTAVRDLPAYRPPLGGRTGLRLDFNENVVGCSPRVLNRLRSLGAEELARYPEREPVEQAVANYLQVSAQELLLTNGVDEAIHLLCEAYLDTGDEALIVVPTFAMYEILARATGAGITQIPADADFSFPTQTVLRHISPKTRLIAIANPNNPTGSVATIEDLLLIAKSAPDAALLVDEAYYEFHGETAMGKWAERPTVFVARTFSKAYGLAGLRAGILMGHPQQIAMIRKLASPYNVNAIALACLPDALGDQHYVDNYVREVRSGRCLLEKELGRCGIPFWPSRANFVLMRLGQANSTFISKMRERGILVRDRSRDPGCEGCVRITLGSMEQTERLLPILKLTLEEIGAIREGARS